jgi:predicted enzyme related to lactoylglutathione lyase
MHKSRLSAIVVDCKEGDMREVVQFWGQALGLKPDPKEKPGQRYYHFTDKAAGINIVLQDMQGKESSAFHIDIETNDVEAEVKRLEALGAKRKRQVKDWWVMTAPTGHTFCVIPE